MVRARSSRVSSVLLLAGILLVTGSAAGGRITDRLATVLQDLPVDAIETGILYDRVLPLSRMAAYDGTAAAPAATLREWRQMYHEIWSASLARPSWPPLDAVLTRAAAAPRQGGVSIAIMDFRYDRIRPDAVVARGDRLVASEGDPWITREVFAAAPLRNVTYNGSETLFRLSAENYFSNVRAAPRVFQIDCDDGRGYLSIGPGTDHAVRYATPGMKTIRIRLVRDDAAPLVASFLFEVRALRTPAPHDTLHIQATIPYQGQLGTGDAYVYLSDQHTTLTNPVIVIEGFDLDNSMGWDELYEFLNRQELLETLRSRGYDVVILDFTDAVDYIQRNAFVAVEMIAQVQAAVGHDQSLALVGASMGGLVGRYALAYMEDNSLEHHVRTFISFDSPQAGADIPLGMQYWLWFFADDSPDAAALLAALDSPAARQLLVYHYTDPPGGTGESDALRSELLSDLAALGDYPQDLRKVAMANGSGAQLDQGFSPGDQIIQWEYTSFLVDMTGNVWAVPDGTSHLIFHGLIDIILLPPDEVFVSVTGTRPFDSAPGGWRDSMAELDASEPPYGDIVALHPHHCFVPTISALAIDTEDLFYDIAGDPDLLAHIPFDAAYFPTENQEHVDIAPETLTWMLAEIEYDASGIADEAPDAAATATVARIDLVEPSPSQGPVRIRFTTPRAGQARLAVYDASGRRIAVLAERHFEVGAWDVTWDGRIASPGVYFLRLSGAGFGTSAKLLIVDR